MEPLLLALLDRITAWFLALNARLGRQVEVAALSLGIAMGPGVEGQSVTIDLLELRRHAWILGGSGGGKTTLQLSLIRQLIQHDQGFAAIDQHGDLVRDVLAWLLASERGETEFTGGFDRKRIVLVMPHETDYCLAFNPLDPGKQPLRVHCNEILVSLQRLFADGWGYRMADLLRHTLPALAEAGYSMPDLTPFLTDPIFRAEVLARVTDPDILAYFAHRFDNLKEAVQQERSEPVHNKWSPVFSHPSVKLLFRSGPDSLNLRELMDSGAWVFIAPVRGFLKDAAFWVCALFLAGFQAAAMSRADLRPDQRRPFTLVCDEAHTFLTPDAEVVLSEARKFGLSLILAHQFVEQIPSTLAEAVAANSATKVVFGCSAKDAASFARQAGEGPDFAGRLTQLTVGHAMVLRRGQSPVHTKLDFPSAPSVTPDELDEFLRDLRRQHGRCQADVEAELATPQRRPFIATQEVDALPEVGDDDE